MFKKIILFTAFLLVYSSTGLTAVSGRNFDRAIIVIFENTNYAAAMKQPFFKQLADQGAQFSNFLALAHPSQGNYIALTSGDLNGVSNDGNHDINVSNIVDLLEAKGLSWKVYAESFPGNCFTGARSNTYVRKHNPFISYTNIQKSPERCSHIVDASSFALDAAGGTLPNYVFYVPDLKNDGHDTGVSYANSWFSQKFGPYVANTQFMQNTILISTFDESGAGPINQIYTSIVGPSVKPGIYPQNLTTPSLLRLLEDNWGLGSLGKQDQSATPITGIWQ